MLARVKTGVAAHEAGTHVACDAQSKRALVAGSYGLAAFDIRDVTIAWWVVGGEGGEQEGGGDEEGARRREEEGPK